MSVTLIDPFGLAGGSLNLPTREAAERAIASMPRDYGLYIEEPTSEVCPIHGEGCEAWA